MKIFDGVETLNVACIYGMRVCTVWYEWHAFCIISMLNSCLLPMQNFKCLCL